MTKRALNYIAVVIMLVMSIFIIGTANTYAASVKAGSGQVDSWNGAYVRSGPSTSYSKVTCLTNNTSLTIHKEVFVTNSSTASSNVWLYVTAGNKTGYIRADLVDNVSYTAVNGKTTDYLNYRAGAGTGMTRYGTLSTGVPITIYMAAQPYNSSTTWYKIKVGSSYCYVCSSWVSLEESIFNDTTKTEEQKKEEIKEEEKKEESKTEETKTEDPKTEEPTEEEEEVTPVVTDPFETQLEQQGFPEDYKALLRQLHAAHPNWVFIAKNTGIDFNTAVSKESKNGVSLVEGCQPLAWRATDSNSFRATSEKTIYSEAGGGSVLGTLPNCENFTILDEVWKGTTQWTHVTTAGGVTGYVSGSLTSQTYSGTIKARLVNDYVNIRTGAGTSNSWIKTLNPYTEFEVVLLTKDTYGATWYKIKYGNGYAYICGEYVTLLGGDITTTKTTTSLSESYPIGTASKKIEYRASANPDFPKLGEYAEGTKVTVIGSVKGSDGNTWYKIYKDGKAVYAPAAAFTIEGTVSETSVPSSYAGVTNDALNYRATAGILGTRLGCFNKGTSVSVIGATSVLGEPWYKINYNGRQVFSCAEWVDLTLETAPEDAKPVTKTETVVVQGAKVSDLTGTGYVMEGTYIPKDGSTWFNANSQAVAYYMDPRNFLNEDRVYMFEDLSYHGEYQTEAVVNKVLSGTALASNGFLAQWFCEAGAKYGMSPVALAARARQETGGGSIAISGYTINGRTVYNPFNIGAYSSDNPVMNGLNYAYNAGWYTKVDAINGGANFIAGSYINKGQNSQYFQRFNVANGADKVATHQYMTNLLAPYSESLTTKNTYAAYGITNESLTFVIPIYSNMPSSTSLPQ